MTRQMIGRGAARVAGWTVAATLAAMLAAGAAMAQQAEAPGPSGRLSVTGLGQIAAEPDMATVRVGVVAEAKTASEALNQTSAATGEMLTLLSEMGVEQRDLQTSDLSLSPIWADRSNQPADAPRIAGYRASNTVVARIRSLGDLGVMLDDIVASGAANEFYGLEFGLQDPEPVKDEARRAAVADAMRKARLYAEAAGLSLGPVLSIVEPGAAALPVAMPRVEAMALAAEPVPVARGELSVRAEVTMIFALSK